MPMKMQHHKWSRVQKQGRRFQPDYHEVTKAWRKLQLDNRSFHSISSPKNDPKK
jgi:hypothetical protein